MQIKTLMRSPVTVLDETTPLARARDTMVREGLAAVPVARGIRPWGMLTERDVHRCWTSSLAEIARYDAGYLLARVQAGEAVRRDFATILPTAGLEAAAARMAAERVESLLVVDGGEPLGIVTARDLLTAVIARLERREPPRFAAILAAVGCGTDGPAVCRTAVALARRDHARLLVLHVLPPLARRLAVAAVPEEALARIAENRKRDAVDRLARLLPADEGVPTTVRVVFGDAAARIAAEATSAGADLVVMGGDRRGWLDRMLGDDTIASVVRRSPCPVLVVGRGEDRHAGR